MSRLIILSGILFGMLGACASFFYYTILPSYDPGITIPSLERLVQTIIVDGLILGSFCVFVLAILNEMEILKNRGEKLRSTEGIRFQPDGKDLNKPIIICFIVLLAALSYRYSLTQETESLNFRNAIGKYISWDVLKQKEKSGAKNTLLLSNMLASGDFTRIELAEMVEEYWSSPGDLRLIVDRAGGKFPPQIWFRLYEHEDENFRTHVIYSSDAVRYNTLKEKIEQDILTGREKSTKVKHAALRKLSSSFKPEVFYALAADESEEMQLAVAANSHTPQPLIYDIITSKEGFYNQYVKRAAFFNLFAKTIGIFSHNKKPVYVNFESALKFYLTYNQNDEGLTVFLKRYYDITSQEKTANDPQSISVQAPNKPKLPIALKESVDLLFRDFQNFCEEEVGFLFRQYNIYGTCSPIPYGTLEGHYTKTSPDE